MPHTREQEIRKSVIPDIQAVMDIGAESQGDYDYVNKLADTFLWHLKAHHKQDFADFLQEEIKHLEGMKIEVIEEDLLALEGQRMTDNNIAKLVRVSCDLRQNATISDLISHYKEKLSECRIQINP